ncbi:MAG TPA: hypothetical protein VF266_16885 [Thermoanaerobaculia bacterium]
MKSTHFLPKSIAVLSLCLLPLIAGAAPAPDDSDGPIVVAQLSTVGANGHTHVQVTVQRPNVTDVTVELFDAEGAVLQTYALRPQEGDHYRPVINIEVAPAFAKATQTARVTAFSTRSTGERDTLFDSGLLKAVPMLDCPAGSCSPTRRECSNYCFCQGCTSAVYSCTGSGGDCVASCSCTGCVQPPSC